MMNFRAPPRFVDFFLVYMLIFMSGSLIYEAQFKMLLIAFFAISCGALVLYRPAIKAEFVLFLCIVLLLLGSVWLYTAGSLPISSVIGTLMTFVVAYVVLRVTDTRFGATYIRVITFLAAVSLVGFGIDRSGLVDSFIAVLPQWVNGRFYEGLLYAFDFSPHINRNNSIFFEPGVYQGFLNFGLFLTLFCELDLTRRQRLIFSAVLLAALITTFSTTGFLIFGVMMVVVVLKGRQLKPGVKIAGFIGVLLVVAMFPEQFSHTILEKLEGYTASVSLEQGVSERRTFDALADMRIFSENILGHGYRDYEIKFSEYTPYLSYTGTLSAVSTTLSGSSNGLTSIFAIYGLPFGVFILGAYIIAVSKLIDDWLLRLAALAMLAMFFNGEAFVLKSMCLAVVVSMFTGDGGLRSSARIDSAASA